MTIVYMFFYFYISKKWYKAKIHTYNKYIQNYTNEHSKCYFFATYVNTSLLNLVQSQIRLPKYLGTKQISVKHE